MAVESCVFVLVRDVLKKLGLRLTQRTQVPTTRGIMSNTYNDAYMKISEVTGSRKKNKLNHIPWEQFENIAKIIGLAPNKKILDAGCGLGGIAKYYASNYGSKIVAVDHSSNMIEYAKKNNSSPLVSYMVGSFPEILSELDTFDVILCILWLSDIQGSRPELIKNFVSKLSKNGYLVIADWLISSDKKPQLIEELRKGWHHQPPYATPKQLRDSLTQTGLKIIKENYLSSDLKSHWASVYDNLIKGRAELYASVDKKIVDDRIHLVEITKKAIDEEILCAPLFICQRSSS